MNERLKIFLLLCIVMVVAAAFGAAFRNAVDKEIIEVANHDDRPALEPPFSREQGKCK